MARSWLRSSSLLGSLALGSACGPLVVLDDGGGEESTDEASEGTGPSSTSAVGTTSPTSSTTSTTSATTTPMTTSVDPTGREPGFCALACVTVDDCLFGGSPTDFECVDGFCEYVGEIPPCDPASCDDLMIGSCTEVDGVSVCATPCVDDSACVAGFTQCSGHDDAGNSICDPIPCWGVVEGEPCEIDGFGQIGICIDGVCACTDDSQCTAEGYGCNV